MLKQLFYQIKLAVFYLLFSIGQQSLLGKIHYRCDITPRWHKTHAYTHLNPHERPRRACLCSDVSHKVQQFNVSLHVSVVNLVFSFLSFVGRECPFKRSKRLTVCSTQYRNSRTQTHKPPAVPGLRLCFYGNSRLPTESLVFFQLSSFRHSWVCWQRRPGEDSVCACVCCQRTN